MRNFYIIAVLLILSLSTFAQAQPAGVSGRTYTNLEQGFEVTFPDTWLIPGDDFEEFLKEKKIDISIKPPETISKPSRMQLERDFKRVTILLTAYRSMPGKADNAVVRIATEDIRLNPAVKDAVDYFDLMRSQFAFLQMPADFTYSETKAEKLGAKQFGFLDISSNEGKKRIYATVRNRVALIFTLTYTKAEDLETFRDILARSKFDLQQK
jgi:hypothetical protein